MLRLSQLFEANRRESADTTMESPYISYPSSPAQQSPYSSMPASPVVSLFSRTHTRFPSSVSSVASSPGMGGSTEGFGTMKTHLTEVKEEPLERETSLEDEDGFFCKCSVVFLDDDMDCSFLHPRERP